MLCFVVLSTFDVHFFKFSFLLGLLAPVGHKLQLPDAATDPRSDHIYLVPRI